MLKLEGISKQFSSTQACIDIRLDIGKGEFFSLLGPSGCGKTTLLRIISGLLLPDSGIITLDGMDVSRVPAHRRNVNTVFQNYALFPHLNVHDNIAFGLKMKGVFSSEINERVAEALSFVELTGYGSRKPGQLSGGQQQRVALARALVNRPQVLLLDEPLAALDVKLRKQVQFELRHLQKKLEMTFVYITHDQEEAMRMSDRIAVMNSGRIEQVGTPEEIYNRPNTRFVANFIGESNFFAASEFDIAGDEVALRIPQVGIVRGRKVNGFVPRAEITLSVRPEKIRILAKDNPQRCGNDNLLTARIEEIVYLGTMHHVVARTDAGHPVRVIRQTVADILPCRPGEDVLLAFSPDHAIALAE